MPHEPPAEPSLAGPGAGAEWRFLAQVQGRFPSPAGALGVGDDAAAWGPVDLALGQGLGQALACTDLLVEGTHFRRGTTTPFALGWKALAVNLSDVAAMGGSPSLALVNLGLDPTAPEWGLGVMAGLGALAEASGTWVAGGDTVGVGPGGAILAGAMLLGQAPRALRRRDARPGDLLLGTGPWGASAAGLGAVEAPEAAAQAPAWARQAATHWHQSPWPRLALGRALGAWAAAGPTRRLALMDDSDGLRASAWLMAEASGVGLVLEAEALVGPPLGWTPQAAEAWAPEAAGAWGALLAGASAWGWGPGAAGALEGASAAPSPGACVRAWVAGGGPLALARHAQAAIAPLAQALGQDPLAWALNGGEDFGLLAACPPEAWPELQALADAEGLPLRPIGRVEAGPPRVWLCQGGAREALDPSGGFDHL